jgi:tRNA A-37 threonylcarbamoyl transferase component Bud32
MKKLLDRLLRGRQRKQEAAMESDPTIIATDQWNQVSTHITEARPTKPARKTTQPATYHAEEDSLQIGDTINNRYVIEELVGEGGFGAVYRAHDIFIDRHVAFKVVRRVSEAEEERLLKEAAIMGKLNSPHVLPVHDVIKKGEVEREGEKRDFRVTGFAAEFIHGGKTLEDMTESSPRVKRALLEQTIKGVDALHTAGIIHRDLKPENVMIRNHDTQPEAVLGDLGISVSPEDMEEGMLIGTLIYMSPEQLTGKKIDQRSDLYALGLTGDFMRNGKHRSRAHTVAERRAEHEKPVNIPRGALYYLSTFLPVWGLGNQRELGTIDTVRRKFLQEDPDDRWQSAAQAVTYIKNRSLMQTFFRWTTVSVLGAGIVVAAAANWYQSWRTEWGFKNPQRLAAAAEDLSRAEEKSQVFKYESVVRAAGEAIASLDEFVETRFYSPREEERDRHYANAHRLAGVALATLGRYDEAQVMLQQIDDSLLEDILSDTEFDLLRAAKAQSRRDSGEATAILKRLWHETQDADIGITYAIYLQRAAEKNTKEAEQRRLVTTAFRTVNQLVGDLEKRTSPYREGEHVALCRAYLEMGRLLRNDSIQEQGLAEEVNETRSPKELYELAYDIAMKRDDNFHLGMAGNWLGVIAITEGDMEKAESLLETALACHEAEGSVSQLGVTKEYLAVVRAKQGFMEEAYQLSKAARAIYQQMGNEDDFANASEKHVQYQFGLGFVSEGAATLEDVIADTQKLNNPVQEGHLRMLLVDRWLYADNVDAAEKAYQEACRILGEQSGDLIAVNGGIQLARLYFRKGETEEGFAALASLRGKEGYDYDEYNLSVAESLRTMETAYHDPLAIQGRIAYLERLAEIDWMKSEALPHAHLNLALTKLYLEAGDLDAGFATAQAAIDNADKTGMRYEQIDIRLMLYGLFRELNQGDREALEQHETIAPSTLLRDLERQFYPALVLEDGKGRPEFPGLRRTYETIIGLCRE